MIYCFYSVRHDISYYITNKTLKFSEHFPAAITIHFQHPNLANFRTLDLLKQKQDCSG